MKGFECKVLNHYFSNLVNGVFIPYILMEWIHIQKNMDNNCPDINTLVKHFVNHRYQPWAMGTKTQLKVTEHYNWKMTDVLWIHEEAKLDNLFANN